MQPDSAILPERSPARSFQPDTADANSEFLHRRLSQLDEMPLRQLRDEWHRVFLDRQMPDRLPRDLLVRTIAWKLQEDAFGRSATLTRKLERLTAQLSTTGTLDLEREVMLKPGTRLIREWHGQTYRVTALEEGWLFDGRQFVSLSQIAREITGTRWSGPRFFGLKPTSSASQARSHE